MLRAPSGYWRYYQDDFDWASARGRDAPDPNDTVRVLKSGGLSTSDAERLMNSGYVCYPGHDTVIDRFYGGAVNSHDGVSRFAPSQITTLFKQATPRAWHKRVSTLEGLRSIVDGCAGTGQRKLVFRGQTKNYPLSREVCNPYLTIAGLGEVSLLPSFWRAMNNRTAGSFLEFDGPSLSDWTRVLYTAFDLSEIEKRHQSLLDSGVWMHTMQDMADSEDELLREFGNYRLDIATGLKVNLADAFATLLQHYGLYSPLLDLSSSLDVALFFATHQYSLEGRRSRYTFVGTNSGQSVIYVIAYKSSEMAYHDDRGDALLRLVPQRPKRQGCVIARSSQYAINLPAFHLIGVIQLDFDLDEPAHAEGVNEYFPSASNDAFLAALKHGWGDDAPTTDFAAQSVA